MTAERLARMRQVLDRRQPDLTVIMAGVHKEHNVSAVMRTCDAVGVPEVHAMGVHGHLAVKRTAAAGVGRRVPLRHCSDIEQGVADLKAAGYRILGAHLDPQARDFRQEDYCRSVAIMLGREKEGLDPEARAVCDGFIAIPMLGLTESLNVSVAAAVILYEAQRQREQAGLYDSPRLDEATYQRLLFEWMQPKLARYCRERNLPYPALDDDGHVRSLETG
ncbi:tRNA (guanosine-2'-O-)-methyltransferase [Natronocella acetinitrilica]|uniref:tRNA (guanosine(18)-2'-O)-methyltransferase n=1 Tax=Natronocella acetinitrilica TaxID=414046 RepID=A0AAE3KAZ7_9GAMM|nr:tRNA (guanosine(18)-2'-O)-methyltransferase TrmH [Natronocella acetinitrilica]MCP1674975.1 tRNA (guanosine-2'-O-)-methyltransferase [Natronocella acetinitrilica]